MLMVPTCNKQVIKHCAALRQQGYTYQDISESIGRSTSAVTRYLRVYEKYGVDVFSDVKNPRETAKACGENKFEGSECGTCGGVLRYVASNGCVACRKRQGRNRRLKARLGE